MVLPSEGNEVRWKGLVRSLSTLIVSMKVANSNLRGASGEKRSTTFKESLMGNMEDTQMSKIEVSTKQERIAKNARRLSDVSFTALAHHIDVNWLREAFRQTRKDAAAGIDGITSKNYAVNLGENLNDLIDRAKSGKYRAPAVKRVHIPKGKGNETRPLGIPTFEDKVLQRSVKMVIEPVYEQDFLDCSYGFRPGRSQHMAIDKMWKELMDMRGGWVIDIDIRKYFDTIDHSLMREILSKRVCDGVITRLIAKWLKVGIIENDKLHYEKEGTPQGGVISPLLSNIYLHEVIDVWFEDVVKPRLKGKAFMIRFADDIIMGFQNKEDALKVFEVLPKRLTKYKLTLHPEKTRLIRFVKPEKESGKPETFDFLGFTHYWGKSRRGNYVIKHKTARDRLARAIGKMNIWLKENRHEKVSDQHEGICRKLRGHYNYYGVTSNYDKLCSYWRTTLFLWKKWLGRRSSKSYINWGKLNRILERYPLIRPTVKNSVMTAKL